MVAVSKHTRVVIWRHGETDWNRASRFQGRTDIAMNALGFEQARRAAPALAAMAPTALYSSPLQRAHATAVGGGARRFHAENYSAAAGAAAGVAASTSARSITIGWVGTSEWNGP